VPANANAASSITANAGRLARELVGFVVGLVFVLVVFMVFFVLVVFIIVCLFDVIWGYSTGYC